MMQHEYEAWQELQEELAVEERRLKFLADSMKRLENQVMTEEQDKFNIWF